MRNRKNLGHSEAKSSPKRILISFYFSQLGEWNTKNKGFKIRDGGSKLSSEFKKNRGTS